MEPNEHKSGQSNSTVDIPAMMQKLDKLFDDEDKLKAEAFQHQESLRKLQIMYEQKREEIDLMESMIMHLSNKNRRQSEWDKKY